MKHDLQFTQALKAGFPVPPQSYYQRIDDTIALLQKRDQASARSKGHIQHSGMLVRTIRTVAAVCAAMLFLSVCTFAVKPALAAELPLIGDAVYALAPTVSAKGEKLEEVAGLVKAAAAAFATGDYAAADALFYHGESWTADEDAYQTAKYLYYILHSAEAFPGDGTKAEAVSFTVTEAAAEQKAFRYEAVVSLELKGKDGIVRQERVYARFIENLRGLYITSIRIESEGYAEYAAQCLSYGLEGLHYENPTAGVAFEAEYLSFMTVHKHAALSPEEKNRLLERLRTRLTEAGLPEQVQEPLLKAMEDEKAILREQHTPAVMSAEELAAEVMYRYYLGRKLKEPQDFSDIVERNEATDLFFYDAQLAVDLTLAGGFSVLDTVEKGAAEILETMKSNDESMTARFHVKTEIAAGPMRGVGEEIVLTLEKRGESWIVTGYDRIGGDGIYVNRLKPLAQQYMEQGLSWQEANKNAYNELLAERHLG